MLATELEKLYQLKEKGILTQEEFDVQKKFFLTQKQLETAEPEHVSLKDAVISYWKKYFVWKGRSTRAEYWWPWVVNYGVVLFLSAFVTLLPPVEVLLWLFSIATFVPSITVLIRRIHDVGHSAWFALSPILLILGLIVVALIGAIVDYSVWDSAIIGILIFVVGGLSVLVLSLVVLVFCCIPGTPKDNEYGPARK